MSFDPFDYNDPYDDDSSENGDERVELSFERLVTQTDAAWLIEFEVFPDLSTVEEWLPKSECEIDINNKTIIVPEWLVFEKCLDMYETGD